MRDAHILREKGLKAFRRGDFERAADFMARACAAPDTPAQHHLAHAEILRRGGQGELAQAAAERAIARDPHCAQAFDMLGAIAVARGQLAESIMHFGAAVEIDPRHVQSLNNLAVVLQRLGRHAESEIRYRQALQLAPRSSEVGLNYAALLGTLGRYREALAVVNRVLAIGPETSTALLLAASLECEIGRDVGALERIDRVLAIGPAVPKILALRSRILSRLGRFDAALVDCDRALAQDPQESQAMHARALALQGLDRIEEALACFRLAEASAVRPASAMVDGAWLLAEMGRTDEALAVLDRALEAQPGFATAWYGRSKLKRYRPGDPDIGIMDALTNDPKISCRDLTYLCFALGNAHLDSGCGARAFERLDMANRLKRGTFDYDIRVDEARFSEIADTYSADTLARLAGGGDASKRPIFVFGMPRSGTTLVEQILASHPLVHGAGEPAHLRDIAGTPGFSQALPGSTPQERAALGRRYLSLAGAGSPLPRFVDKTPLNFLHAGLISLILPGARMIHCRRDPLDTCLSIYALLFTSGHEFAYDLGELGRYYGLYRKLMAHWRRVLPTQILLEIDYEALVRGTETEVRKLLDFCELPWDARCLDFYRTPRRVASSSLAQVRAPIYTTSIGRARAFRPWLGRLEDALAASD